MAREIRQIKRDVERRRKSWMTTAIPKKKKNAVTQFPPGNAYVASGRSWKKKKERWRRSSLTSTRVTSVELSVTGCEWVRERERYIRNYFSLWIKISLQRKIISTQKAFEKERYKDCRDVDSNTMSRLLNCI